MCDQQSLRPACAYAPSVQSLCKLLKYSISVKLLTKHHLEFLSLNEVCTCSSESTLATCHIVGNYMSRLISQFQHAMNSVKLMLGSNKTLVKKHVIFLLKCIYYVLKLPFIYYLMLFKIIIYTFFGKQHQMFVASNLKCIIKHPY